MKYKVGDKVKVVKPEGVGIWFNGRVGIISGIQKDRYLVDGVPLTWGEDELKLVEENQGKESIFDKLAHSIAEAAKETNILVEPTEDGGIKISPLEVKPKPSESGIYIDKELPHVHVIFGGKIHVAVGECKAENGFTIGLQELEELKECGGRHNEEWVKEKPTVNLIINNKNTIKILRDALDMIELKLSKEGKE